MKSEFSNNMKKAAGVLLAGCLLALLVLVPSCKSVNDETEDKSPRFAEEDQLREELHRAMTAGPVTLADDESPTVDSQPETGTVEAAAAAAPTLTSPPPEALPPAEEVVAVPPDDQTNAAAARVAGQPVPSTPTPEGVPATEGATTPRPIQVPEEQLPPGAQPPSVATASTETSAGGAVPGSPTAASSTNANDPLDEVIPHPVFNFPAIPLDQVLEVYAQTVGRTVLRPSSLPATQITLVTQTPLTRREAIQALDSILALNGITMIPSGEKFVKAVPEGIAFQQAPKFYSLKDTSQLPEAAQYITHIVQLKFVRPSEIIQVLQPFAKMPNGLLPIDSNQMLVIRDYAENVKRMLEIIEDVDISVPLEFEPVVIPIKYALATDIATVLSSLTTGGGGNTVVGSSTRSPSSTITPGGGTTFPGSNPLQRNNNAMNQSGVPQSTFGANSSGRGTFSQRLQQIVSRAASAGEVEIIGPNKIIADERTNSLLIFATRQDLATIRDIVDKLDVVLAQVLIEAIIMEVSLNDDQTVGVSAAQRPRQWTDFLGAGGFKNASFTNLLTGVSSNLISSLPSGFAYTGVLNNDWEVIVQAIASDSRINVLSRPRIQTSHAVPATLFVGNSVPFVTGTSTGFGDVRQTFQNQRVGITLDVLPLINPDGLVVMDIRQEVQQLGNPVQIDGNPVPTTVERNALTKVAVKDRDTIILGGFISSTKSNSKSGVPFLKDIPLLGALFRSSTDSNQRVELIALIRPTVLPTPEAAALQVDVEKDRLPNLRRAEKDWDKEEAKSR